MSPCYTALQQKTETMTTIAWKKRDGLIYAMQHIYGMHGVNKQ
jgi:hypothetical protein